jgi:spermidine synthase
VVSNIEEGVNTKVLLTNGKFQGDDGEQTQAQIALAALPTMQLANRHDALVIGFGTGQSAGMLADFGYSAVDIAEISPGILEASRVHFAGLNQNVLSNSRANVFVEDGRNVLLTRPKQYDLIAIEVSSIWFAGATNIYSREFYELAKARLKPRGVIQQWIQLHHITPREIGTIMGTIHGSFRYVTLWYFGGQGIIIASEHPQAMEPAGYAAVYQSMLRQFKNDGNKAQAFTKALSSSQLLDSEGVSRLAARHRDTNTDWNRWLEYWTPTYALSEEDWPTINVTALLKYRSPATSAEVR